MINEVILKRLDELIGDFDTPFFNYLMYSYDLGLQECEEIIEKLKNDISSNKIISQNIVSTLDDYFKSKVSDLEKQEKIEFLDSLIREDSDFYTKFLKKYELSSEEISLIHERVETKITYENISDFAVIFFGKLVEYDHFVYPADKFGAQEFTKRFHRLIFAGGVLIFSETEQVFIAFTAGV